MLSRGAVITDAATGKRRWLGCHVDITEHKQLLEALHRSEDDYRQLNASLDDRVKARTAELEAANHELDAYNYSVSHDLRAPLRSVEGFSQALLEDHAESLDAAGRDYLQRINAAAQRMAVLTDAMYQLSKLTRSLLQVREDDYAGHGVGLTTVQRIVRRHGGRIWAEGTKGQGAVFYFTLWSNAALRRTAEADFQQRLA